MARNKYPGYCYSCGEWVESGYGHFEKVRGAYPGAPKWRIKCVKCASGRILTDDDRCVQRAKKAFEEEQMKKKGLKYGMD